MQRLKSEPDLIASHAMPSPPAYRNQRLFGLDILATTFEQAVDLLCAAARRRDGRAAVVVTPNVDHIVRLDKDPAFKAAYQQADFIFADGMPVVWASRLLGRPLPERVTGADLFVALCQRAAQQQLRVALLGGMPGQEEMLRERFARYYPGIQVDISCPSMRFDPMGAEGLAAVERIRAQQADIVFVCLGMPKQENWSLQHAGKFDGGIVLCVGAAMEFALGLQKRAPLWVQRNGLEWLWRLLSNPRRMWRRYLVQDPRFAVLCWQEWRARRQDPARDR